MNKTNTTTNNKYGNLLDKYLDSNHTDYKTKQECEEEAKSRYGYLLDRAKPDNSILDRMSKIEDNFIEQRKQREEEERLAVLRRQERLENERRREEEHNAKVKAYGESLIINKQRQIEAEQKAKEEKKKEAEEKQKIYDNIDDLMKISPESADAYIQALKMGGVI